MYRLLYGLFAFGLCLKMLHMPYHTIVLFVVLASLLAWSVVRLAKRPGERAGTFIHIAITAWLLHGVILLKLLPVQMISLSLALLMTGLSMVLVLRNEVTPRTALGPLFIVGVLVLGIMAVPVPTRYHFTSLLFSSERHTDAHSWDKYSFLLHRHGNTAAALSANDSAQVAAQRSDHDELLPVLLEHRRLLTEGDWLVYDGLGH